MSKYKLLCIGTPLLDVFYEADFEFLRKHSLEIGCTNHLSDEQVAQIESGMKPILETAGDNARNVCESFVKSGGENCAYLGNVSGDETGEKIRKNLRTNGILDLTQTVDGKTGRIMCVITPDKQRTFAVYLGVGEKEITIEKLELPKILFFTNITYFGNGVGSSCGRLARKCRENGVKIAISLESENLLRRDIVRVGEICRLADYLFLNEDEMRAVGKTEKDVGKLASIVFLKKGKEGCAVFENGAKIANIDARKVDVVDTTGAGDFFAGAVLFAISEGKNPLEAAEAGNEMAARVIQKIGAEL